MIHVLINTLAEKMNEFLSNFTMTVAQGGKGIFSGKPDEVGTFGGNGCLLGLQMRINRIKSYFLS